MVEVIYLKDRLGQQGRWERRRGMTETIPRHVADSLVKAGAARIVAETKMIEPAEVKLASVSPPIGPETKRPSRKEKKKQAKENG